MQDIDRWYKSVEKVLQEMRRPLDSGEAKRPVYIGEEHWGHLLEEVNRMYGGPDA